MWRKVRKKGGGGGSERKGTVEINSLKKRGQETLLPWHAMEKGLEARQYEILLSSKSTQEE